CDQDRNADDDSAEGRAAGAAEPQAREHGGDSSPCEPAMPPTQTESRSRQPGQDVQGSRGVEVGQVEAVSLTVHIPNEEPCAVIHLRPVAYDRGDRQYS